MDQILAYMYMMLEEAKGKLIVNRRCCGRLGKDVQLFDGVSDWFARVNEYAGSRGLTAGALYHLFRSQGDHRGHADCEGVQGDLRRVVLL